MNDDLIKMSGEEFIKQRPKYVLPIIRFNGREGMFYLFRKDEEGNYLKVKLGEKIQGTVLKVRRSFIGWGKDYGLFSNEHNNWKDKMTLFERREGKVSMVDVGTSVELRPKYPELKMVQVLYFLLEPKKEVVKLLVKGKGLQNLFNFWDEFGQNEHVYQYLLEIRAEIEKGRLGEYYYPSFARLREVDDMNLIANKIREVANKIAEVENYYEASSTPPEEIVGIIEDQEQPENIEFEQVKTEEDIDIKDIPL